MSKRRRGRNISSLARKSSCAPLKPSIKMSSANFHFVAQWSVGALWAPAAAAASGEPRLELARQRRAHSSGPFRGALCTHIGYVRDGPTGQWH